MIEDILVCPDDGGYGGVATLVEYAQIEDIKDFPQSVEGGQVLGIHLTLNDGKTWERIPLFLDQNSLSEKAQGGVKRWKNITEFSAAILGIKGRNLDFVSKIKNENLVFIIPDNNGTKWLMGTPMNPTRLTSYEANTGKKIEDDPLISLGFTAHTRLLEIKI